MVIELPVIILTKQLPPYDMQGKLCFVDERSVKSVAFLVHDQVPTDQILFNCPGAIPVAGEP
jgi:hypothetical protein